MSAEAVSINIIACTPLWI